MSDGFDKEAEREKLREKFAKDDEKREHTQRMSELLLKGATMTNRHCDDCGDPIFRQDGREFCPSCHTVDAADVDGNAGATVDGTAGNAATTDGVTGNPAAADGAAATSEATANETADTGSRPQPRARNVDSGSQPEARNAGSQPGTRNTGSQPRSTEADATSPGPAGAGANDGPQAAQNPSHRATQRSQNAAAPSRSPGDQAPVDQTPVETAEASGRESVADARESLTRTLTRFARAAESADDPRRAREHLRAAREAAETLAALE